jgi:hypothetical protein
MRSFYLHATVKTVVVAVCVLLLTGGLAFAQQQINLSAGPAAAALPDGQSVPMWGYSCGAPVSNSTATCSALNLHPNAGTTWSPVVITVPTGQDLQINLTNNLSFNGNNIPTSLVIVGQLGGGLGNSATTVASPVHVAQASTWPIANGNGVINNPPPQGPRVQSFATEVAVGTPASLTWKNPRPGTYLIESGTHPSIQGPMGLYGILVVTSAPGSGTTGTAYLNIAYNAEVPLLFSEIDPAQNNAVAAAVGTNGFQEASTLGPYAAGPVATVKVVNGGAGYTSAPNVTFSGTGGATATAIVDMDPTSSTYQQVTEIDVVTGGSYTSAPNVIISGSGCTTNCATAQAALQLSTSSTCSGSAAACYPPAVNYTPLYYLINGVAFDKTNASASLFPVSPATSVTGNVLVRLVNAGLRMHIPSIVGSQTGTGTSTPGGFSLIAEDGNHLPGVPRVQSEVFMAAGKTYDVMINAPATVGTALPVFDRQLSLSGNATGRDTGMLAYIGINGSGLPAVSNTGSGAFAPAVARDDTYNSLISGKTLTVSDPSKGLVANDTNVYGVSLVGTVAGLTLNPNGTFTYSGGPATFTYCANGTVTGTTCSSGITATVTLGAATLEASGGITCTPPTYTSSTATYLAVKSPGVLTACKDAAGYPLTVDVSTVAPGAGLALVPDASGGFTASVAAAGPYSFTFQPKNSQGTLGAAVTVSLSFQAGSGLAVTVLDGADKKTVISDYRWVIEEDRTFYVDPNCTTNPLPPGCPTVNSQGTPAVFGTNFHTSYMPVVATGCTGPLSCESGQKVGGASVVCDQGNGICRPDMSGNGLAAVDPKQVYLDPHKRYYISVLPGDAANPFNAGYAGAPDCSAAGVAAGSCGHGMGGAPINAGQTSVIVLSQPSPYPPAKLTVFVFEDDYPLNGENDAGGTPAVGPDGLAVNEPGLGGFEITLFDDAGGTGDATGQPTYDMFNMPLTNSLAGTIDPTTGLDACPIAAQTTVNATKGDGSQRGIVGMIVTCPTFESDGKTMSPMAGQAVVNNLYAGRYGVVATPGADRIARGEEWLQTNTLDGQKAHDSFMRIGEPAYFQEFGPGGYHVSIGFANPKIINARKAPLCTSATPCTNEVKGHATTARMSRPPDERLYGSGSRDSFAFTQCYASLGDPEGADFAFVKCDASGNFDFTNIPAGNWKLTIFDQWNDQIVDGISTPVGLSGSNTHLDLGEVAVHQWQANIYTRSFIDTKGNGFPDPSDPGLALVSTNIRFRDGSFSNFNNTDLNGFAGFNEVFPLFNWYVVETDSTRYKSTGTHVVYDAGGPTDGNGGGSSSIAANYANTLETNSLPTSLRFPGSVYCDNADCTGFSIANGPINPMGGSSGPTAGLSTGRIDPPTWFGSYGWQGFSGQNSFIEFGKKPYASKETGGIRGHVVYASTRPFDDPQLLLQTSWEPLVPRVTLNLYLEGTAPDGSQSLTLVDTTQTSSFDDWAQGFHLAADGKTKIPNMNCPGQSTSDLFFFGLQDQPNYLDWYNSLHGGPAVTPLPNSSQFKCYDGMHNWNQVQPAPYDGMYSFPSVTSTDPVTGKPVGTNCTGCTTNPDTTDPFRYGTPMLPPGKYVVEVVVPPGFELVKEEDKNILIGDNYIAPVTQQFGGLGNIFILPDQAEIASGASPYNSTQNQGRAEGLPSHEGDTGSVETFWPCVGEARVVPDYISLFPQSQEVAPFAGATRHLCDRKEVTLTEQTAALAKFYIFTSTHVASHFTGVITDDFTAEFDPFSPQFGEKFAPAYLPVSIKDWAGNEVSRVYSDQWGAYNGLSYSTWEVNPPNPTGYGPTMMVTCMNDAGAFPDPQHPGQTIPDPLFQAGYSQFCYELPFMPGQTGYFDTPVVPTSSFSEGYNHPDCNYPDATPAIASVTSSDIAGPWVSAAGHMLTITALGDKLVDNYGYSGPSATMAPFNQQKVNRHYGFGTTAGTVALVGSDGVSHPLTGVSWGDMTITGAVPSGVPDCPVQQQIQFGGPPTVAAQREKCGELVITAANGKQSVDTVTVTIGNGGKKPPVLAAGQTIQSAIDAAKPGDMIIVPPGVYNELLVMWKPVRLQGVGAASTVLNANTHPAGQAKLDPWRRQVVCLFGLGLDGTAGSYDPSCGSGWVGFHGTATNPQVDRLPLEATVGWDVTLNGNLAEQLIEPTLMGAYEGAGITVLGKGVRFPAGSQPFAADVFPTGTVLLDGSTNSTTGCGLNSATAVNPFPSNFWCNPSSIDGLSVTNSSQGGGGIMVHGWGHNIQIANTRVHNNQGTLSGGITIGQGEHPDAYLAFSATNTIPGSCENSIIPNLSLPFCFDMHVNVHNNAVTLNSSLGDELFSSTPAGAGGVTLCTGSDYYLFNYNWVCGNMSTGDGGGVAHLGYIKNGDIEHNSILFNQSTNPTITTNGGGLIVMGAPDVDPPCSTTDQDCVSAPNLIGPSDGTGRGLVINANLIQGNSADSGSGGGLRLEHINGTDVVNFPNGLLACLTLPLCAWNNVTVTNNIITDNVAGWDGAGVSLQDALVVNLVNNTIVSNDATASSGVLFTSLFAPLASSPGNNCTVNNGAQSCPQVAGLVSVTNSPVLQANLPANFRCPPGHGTSGTGASASCRYYSVPLLYNDVIWKNRSYFIGVGGFGTGNQSQQKVVSLYNSFTTTQAPSQSAIGACPSASYWDIGVRGDTGPSNHVVVSGNTLTLSPAFSVLTDASDYPGANNAGADPSLIHQYCNGSRVPPENGGVGWLVPPGTNETNGLPTPVFSLTPSATVDEGNNWINMRWGPLALANPVNSATLGNYGLALGSPAINQVTSSNLVAYSLAPNTDFYGHGRKGNLGSDTLVDIGAVEVPPLPTPTLTSISPNTGTRGTSVSVSLSGTNFATTGTTVAVSGAGVSVSAVNVTSPTTLTATFTIAATLLTTPTARNVTVAVSGLTSNPVTFTVVNPPAPTLTSVNPNNGARGNAVPVTLTGTNFTATGTTFSVSGTGVAVSGISVIGSTTATAIFTITSGAALGLRNVTVTNPNTSATASNAFTVTGATLGFTGPSPALTTTPANTATKTGFETVTNTTTGATAGPFQFTAAPTITRASGTGTFSIIAGGTCTATTVLAPSASCTINVQYAPGGSTVTATAHVNVTGTGAATGTVSSTNFSAN